MLAPTCSSLRDLGLCEMIGSLPGRAGHQLTRPRGGRDGGEASGETAVSIEATSSWLSSVSKCAVNGSGEQKG